MTNKKSGANLQKVKVATRSPRNNKNTPAKQAINKSNKEDRCQRIATAAYYRAEKRGFIDGDAVQDWLKAEMEADKTRQI